MVQRIEKLETLLSESGLNSQGQSVIGKEREADEQLTKQLSTLIVNDPGNSHYWGTICNLSIDTEGHLFFDV
jgi:hypothetical protein